MRVYYCENPTDDEPSWKTILAGHYSGLRPEGLGLVTPLTDGNFKWAIVIGGAFFSGKSRTLDNAQYYVEMTAKVQYGLLRLREKTFKNDVSFERI